MRPTNPDFHPSDCDNCKRNKTPGSDTVTCVCRVLALIPRCHAPEHCQYYLKVAR